MKPSELPAKWRNEADEYPAASDERAHAAAVAVRLCADELEAALAPEAGAEPSDQSEDADVVNAVTAAMREADRVFEKVGGSTRHHVRDCLLPVLNKAGWFVLRAPLTGPAVEPPAPEET